MNPILMVCYNNLDLTKKAVDSALNQDIPINMVIVNNGSTDFTRQWLDTIDHPNLTKIHLPANGSPPAIVNGLLPQLFANSDYVLALPNDIRIPSNCYSEMLKWPRGFVCASDNGHNEPLVREVKAVSENTPMGVMMIRKWAWQAIMAKDGHFFDEQFFHYASDCDLALRMAACGIRGVQLDIPYWHYRSASIRLADPFTFSRLRDGADEDRRKFIAKWGFAVDSLEYGQCPANPNWKG